MSWSIYSTLMVSYTVYIFLMMFYVIAWKNPKKEIETGIAVINVAIVLFVVTLLIKDFISIVIELI